MTDTDSPQETKLDSETEEQPTTTETTQELPTGDSQEAAAEEQQPAEGGEVDDAEADTGAQEQEEEEEEEEQKDLIPGLLVSSEKVGEVEYRMDVEVPWVEVQKRLDEAYKELGKSVTLKGFRKGKVPKKMLQKLFAKHVDKEVMQRLVQESIETALRRSEIKPVGEPKFDFPGDGIDRDAPFKYSATMETVPEIVPRDYFDLEVTSKRKKVTDEEVESSLQMKQRELTDYRAVEGRDTAAGDVLLVSVMGRRGDGEVVDIENRSVELSDPPVEPLPGLAAALTGVASDAEDLELELDLPGDDESTQKAELLVTIHDVKQKVVPELDDEFAKDTGEAESLEELRKVLYDKLVEQAEEAAREEAKRLLVKQIIDSNDVPVIPALVDRYLEQRLRLQKMLMGIDPKEASAHDQALKDSMYDDAVEMVQSGLILEAISDAEKIKVARADVDARLEELAEHRGVNAAKIRSEYEKDNGMDALRRRLREDKTLDLLMSKANIIIEENTDEPEQPAAAEQAEPETTADDQNPQPQDE